MPVVLSRFSLPQRKRHFRCGNAQTASDFKSNPLAASDLTGRKGRFRKRVVLANVPSFRFSFRGNMRTYPRSGFSFRRNIRMYPRSGFRSGGTSECTLVPVFVPGEHPPKPPFWKTTLSGTPDGLKSQPVKSLLFQLRFLLFPQIQARFRWRRIAERFCELWMGASHMARRALAKFQWPFPT